MTEINLKQLAQNAKNASYKLASLSTNVKNAALIAIAQKIEDNKDKIICENKKDLVEAERLVQESKLTRAAYNRVKLDDNKMRDMVQGIRDMVELEDPVNKKLWAMEMDKNLNLYKVSCPIGVIGVIFEARPDVVPQIASLSVKSANAVILKGGREAAFSNEILANLINEALSEIKEFPKNAINLIKTREDVAQMLEMSDYIDLIIPRGGNSLVRYIQSNTKIPVLGHAAGICHIYVEEDADFNKAINICVDAKIQYPSACNAVETILVNKKLSQTLLSQLIDALQKAEVVVRGDEICQQANKNVEKATDDDFGKEYGDKIVCIRTVDNIMDAIDYVNTYSSGHTDAIITEDAKKAELFMDLVDSAGVFHNASTRFSDGFRYGLGAEVGISTNKTHARGPVGLEGLVIYKYKLYGNGQYVGEYANGSKKFTHHRLI